MIILIVAWMGAQGGLTHAMGSFGTYVGNRDLKASWLWWYGLKPVLSAAVAVLVFLVFRGGAGGPGPRARDGRLPEGGRVCRARGTVRGAGDREAEGRLRGHLHAARDPREDKTGQAPAVARGSGITGATAKKQADGTIVIDVTGKGFAKNFEVKIGGTPFSASWVSPFALKVTVPPGKLQATDHKLVVQNDPPAGGASRPAKVTIP